MCQWSSCYVETSLEQSVSNKKKNKLYTKHFRHEKNKYKRMTVNQTPADKQLRSYES